MVVRNIQSPLHRNFANLTNPHTCNEFKLFHGEVVQSTLEEKQFPLAFSLAVHANIKQAARLLRLIYRSHNMYCIHVDSKSPQLFYDEVMQLARCFGSNVIVVNRSESVNVKWGYYSVLEVFLLCAEKLINNSEIIWKYILNVSGQELPLRTNWELVALLKAMNGSNIVENLGPKHNPERWPKKNLTFPIIWSKGSFYMALKRDFVYFYQTDPKAKEILDALKAERNVMKHPDELFFSTLNSNPLLGAPGSCNQTYLTSYEDVRAKYIGRYVKWADRPCRRGKNRRGICLIGISILPYIPERMELFANKFSETFEPIAYDCTENYIMEKVLTEMKTHQLNPNFNLFQGHIVQSSMEEKQFPLAFSISVHTNIKQVARLFRLIYRSHNLYCIHVDSKSSTEFYDQVLELAKCFGLNVIVLNRSESINIRWGYYSILEAFLLCADKLMKNTDYPWKYLLNVNGQELPLRTNWELVAALKAINGSNVVEGLGPKFNPSRWPKKKLSFPIIWNKGSFYMALKREFVQFYQTDQKANELLEAIKAEKHLKKHPDELFFPTLTHNPLLGAPGACNEIHRTNKSDSRKKFIARYVTWFHEGCKSPRVRRGVCIIGINDLPYLTSGIEFFANKFHDDFEPMAYDCTEYYIMKKVLNEMKSKQLDPNFDVTHYSMLHCSQNHI
ncbi:unnamed protein product [Schistosoma turkestanicum]|nr:unnamed protein product [Schistosoma turkestanicum]